MELKPPVVIAIVAALLVLLVGGFMWYDKHQKAAMSEGGNLPRSQYMPPRPP